MRMVLFGTIVVTALAAGCSGSAPASSTTPGAASTVNTKPIAGATVCAPDAPTTDSSTPGIPRPLVCGRSPGKFDVQHTASGAFFVDERKGTGEEAVAGKTVRITYKGYLVDGTLFDDSAHGGVEATEFVLGAGNVIKAWDEGIASMRVGGQRRLGVPPQAAFGAAGGLDGKVPPNASLAYDIELVEVR